MNLDNLKLIGLNIKDYLVDIFLLLVVGLFTNLIINLLNKPLHDNLPFNSPNNYDIFPLSVEIIKVSVWIISFLLIRWLMGKRITTFLSGKFKNEYSFNTRNELTEERLIKEWVKQGNVSTNHDGLLISNSNSGCLIKPRFIFLRIWKDFTAIIKIKFPSQEKIINPKDDEHDHPECNELCQKEKFKNILGIVFRAQNFDDYFMLEICYINKNIVIRPHVRVGGNWDAPELNPDFDSYTLDLEENKDIGFVLKVKGNKVTLCINDDEDNPLVWLLPNFAEPRMIQHTLGGANDKSKTVISEIYFKNRAGMFGFRNYPNELALIQSLSIH